MAAMSSCAYNVPEAMVVEILSWLPPKSLNRLKCVCKSWNSPISCLMSNPAFVANHLRTATPTNNILPPESLLILGVVPLDCYDDFHDYNILFAEFI
ncbi:F-box domain containing protein [Trema orientale]|uniref:F-box domain containing protein n=1 Tax=Trema orientale TaxID=63057 RepID=A0A2P5B5N8_TREOI|nr:F-box domain containing protein [Trema orientale]